LPSPRPFMPQVKKSGAKLNVPSKREDALSVSTPLKTAFYLCGRIFQTSTNFK
jgi:hypothetical protein